MLTTEILLTAVDMMSKGVLYKKCCQVRMVVMTSSSIISFPIHSSWKGKEEEILLQET